MFSLLLNCPPQAADALDAELWEAGAAGVIEEPGARRAFFDEAAEAAALLARFAAYQPEFRIEPDIDWEEHTRSSFPPLEIGRRFFLAPPWNTQPTPPDRLRLVIEPGMGCGTGWHPCTQLCLEAMEEHVKPGTPFVDVGCGSGILSVAAALLGTTCIAACDIDNDAIVLARARFDLPLFTGSASALGSRIAGAIAANISSAAVEEMAFDLDRVRRTGGVIIVSGFPLDDEPALPFPVLRRLSRLGW